MARDSDIRVNPGLLVWARETVGEDISTVAKRLNVPVQTVQSWEKGEEGISYSRLESLADFYRRPVASFFLPEVPIEFAVPTDFRTPNRKSVRVSRDLRLAIRHARFVRNSFIEINPNHKKFVHKKISTADDIKKVASNERKRLGVTFEDQKGWPTDKAYSNWTGLLENAGILVLQKSLEEEELNGFSLVEDGNPPVIVINSKDVPARKTFTLFHEYCHILLEAAGICKIKSNSKELQTSQSIESVCDKFAAAFLVPDGDFFVQSEVQKGEFDDEESSIIRRLAIRFKVSKQVILLKLLVNNKISRSFYESRKKKFDEEFRTRLKKKKEREKASPGGPPPYIISLSENGRVFTRSVVKAYREGKISNKEVSGFTGVRLRHIPNLESML